MEMELKEGYLHGYFNDIEYPFFYDGYLKSQLYTKAEIDAKLAALNQQLTQSINANRTNMYYYTDDDSTQVYLHVYNGNYRYTVRIPMSAVVSGWVGHPF